MKQRTIRKSENQVAGLKTERVYFQLPDEILDQVTSQFAEANYTAGTKDNADFAVVYVSFELAGDVDFGQLPVILLQNRDHEKNTVLGQMAKTGADGLLTLPLRPHDIHAQILLAKHNRRLKQIQQRKLDNLEMNLRQRRSIERAIEMISTQRNMSRVQAYEFMRKTAMDERLPIWGLAERIVQQEAAV